MADLTIAIESQWNHKGQYVVWGTYRQNEPDDSQRLASLGRGFFFTANLALRSRLIRLAKGTGRNAHDLDHAVSREWIINPEARIAIHRSGIKFEFSEKYCSLHIRAQASFQDEQVDHGLFPKAILEESLGCLAQEALYLLDLRSLTRSMVIRRYRVAH